MEPGIDLWYDTKEPQLIRRQRRAEEESHKTRVIDIKTSSNFSRLEKRLFELKSFRIKQETFFYTEKKIYYIYKFKKYLVDYI